MKLYTYDEVAYCMTKNLGRYRVLRAQEVASQGSPDGISGALLIALAIRENKGLNEEGGVMRDADGQWVKQTDPMKMDIGVFQINRGYHYPALKAMPGVKSGTWTPVVAGKSAADPGYVMRFEDSLRWIIPNFHENLAAAEDYGVVGKEGISTEAMRVKFAIAAHNAGARGAYNGYKEGDVDKYTADGDYSTWVLTARSNVNRFLGRNPNWTPMKGSM